MSQRLREQKEPECATLPSSSHFLGWPAFDTHADQSQACRVRGQGPRVYTGKPRTAVQAVYYSQPPPPFYFLKKNTSCCGA